MSRNLCKTNCDWCGCDEVDLTGPGHPITPNEAGRYFSQFERLIVADAECMVCGAKYLAWVDSEPRGFFDLSYRSSFSDEPEEADMGFASPEEIRGYMRRLRELVRLEGDTMKDATQINTAIPLVVKRDENYADRLTRWMRQEYGLDWLDQRDEGRDVREWIPVTERLPEEGERVLVYGNDRGDWFYMANDFRVCGRYSTEFGSWTVDEDTCSKPTVTHWMPLPSPPK